MSRRGSRRRHLAFGATKTPHTAAAAEVTPIASTQRVGPSPANATPAKMPASAPSSSRKRTMSSAASLTPRVGRFGRPPLVPPNVAPLVVERWGPRRPDA
jgi:hypothetical protein